MTVLLDSSWWIGTLITSLHPHCWLYVRIGHSLPECSKMTGRFWKTWRLLMIVVVFSSQLKAYRSNLIGILLRKKSCSLLDGDRYPSPKGGILDLYYWSERTLVGFILYCCHKKYKFLGTTVMKEKPQGHLDWFRPTHRPPLRRCHSCPKISTISSEYFRCVSLEA